MAQVATVTSAQMWVATGLVAAVDVVVGMLLTRRIEPPWRPGLSRRLLVVGPLLFAGLLTWAFGTFWRSCYGYALPAYLRSLAPVMGLVLGAAGWVFWQVARRAGRWAVPVFLALGALESIPGHVNGIYRFSLLDRCPLILGITPTSALLFGVFEFAFYWCVVFAVSAFLAGHVPRRASGSRGHR